MEINGAKLHIHTLTMISTSMEEKESTIDFILMHTHTPHTATYSLFWISHNSNSSIVNETKKRNGIARFSMMILLNIQKQWMVIAFKLIRSFVRVLWALDFYRSLPLRIHNPHSYSNSIDGCQWIRINNKRQRGERVKVKKKKNHSIVNIISRFNVFLSQKRIVKMGDDDSK